MCIGFGIGGPPYGIPITEDIHNQLPQDVQQAWETFDEWWQKARKKAAKSSTPIRRSDMPKEVMAAMELVLKTPVPGYSDHATCAESCYMVAVQALLED